MSVFLMLWTGSPAARADMKIFLDPAFGGTHKGLSYGTLSESQLLLDLASSIQDQWDRSKKAPIVLTRVGDYDLDVADRRKLINAEDEAIWVHLALSTRKSDPKPWVKIHVLEGKDEAPISALTRLDHAHDPFYDTSLALASEMALVLPSNGKSGQVSIDQKAPMASLYGISAPAVALEIFFTPAEYDPDFNASQEIKELSEKIALGLDLFVQKGIFRSHDKKRRKRASSDS
ncbi:MAG: N-acetylmuramoyl-L-alanine amidase [Bdellovibrionota bacterium]